MIHAPAKIRSSKFMFKKKNLFVMEKKFSRLENNDNNCTNSMNSLVSENLSCSSGPGQNIDRHKISKKEQLIIYIFFKKH